MKFQLFSNFLKGLFEQKGAETRVANEFLTKLINFDILSTGSLRRRRGYDYWDDLQNDNSVAADGVPDVTGKTGFAQLIQGIFPWTDVGGNRYVFVVCQGKIYAEYLEETGNTRTWILLNPSGTINVQELQKHIKCASYYDIVFFNDLENNVLMYNSFNWTGGGYSSASAKFIYFAGDRIFLRDHSDFSTYDRTWLIAGVTTGSKRFDVAGDQTSYVEPGDKITVSGSTGNDGTYNVNTVTYSAPNTQIVVVEAVPDATVDGNFNSPYRVKIEDVASNLEGKAVFDGLDTIGYVGTGHVVTNPANLAFGHCIRAAVGSEYFFFVLDNGKNQRADDTCAIVKFNDRFIAQDYVQFDMDANAEVISFGYYDGYLYLFCEDGVIQKISTADLSATELTDSDCIAGLSGVTVSSGKKQYSINANAEGLFAYSETLPTKTDWYQPVVPGSYNFTSALGSGYPTPGSGIGSFSGMPSFTSIKWIQAKQGGYKNFEFRHYKKDEHDIGASGGTYYYRDHGYCMVDYNFSIAGAANYLPLIAIRASIANSDLAISRHTYADFYVSPWGYATVPSVSNLSGGIWGIYLSSSHGDITGMFHEMVSVSDGASAKAYQIHGTLYSGGQTIVRVYASSGFPFTPTQCAALFRPDDGGDHGSSPYYNRKFSMPYYNTSTSFSLSVTSYAGGTLKDYRSGRYVDWTAQKIAHHTKLAYDKTATLIPDFYVYSYASTTLTRSNETFFLYGSSYYNPAIFSDMNTSDYCLLIGMDHDGSFLTKTITTVNEGDKTWRFLLPLGRISSSEIRAVAPIEFQSNFLYFGNSMVQSSGVDNGVYMKLGIENLDFTDYSCNTSCQKALIQGDTSSRWFMRGDPDDTGNDAKFRTNFTWEYSGGTIYDDFVDLLSFNSNLSYHLFKQIISLSEASSIDKIQHIGTPKPATVDLQSGSGTLEKGTKLRYKIAFQFYSSQTTMLSADSDEVTVPDLGSDPQAVKIVLTGLNLENFSGYDIYEFADVEKILIYRKQLNVGETIWTEPLYVAALTKNGSDEWQNGSFDPETYEDSTQDISYNPFTEANVLKYPCRDFCLHKARLVLINKTNEENSNIICYSAIDLADAIPPDNVRSIESGDGDSLFAGVSLNDYLYLFKRTKIYAILGDVEAGQLIDISRTVGCQYTNVIASYLGAIYFINENGIYSVGNNSVISILKDRLSNYFDANRDDCIDFDAFADNAFSYVDNKRHEIYWFVPVKRKSISQNTNNTVIVYNIEYDYFRIYEYAHDAFTRALSTNVLDGTPEILQSDYDGRIRRISDNKNDDGQAIDFIVRTKSFDADIKVLSKCYKLIKVAGKNLKGARLTYWLDGGRLDGDIITPPALLDDRSMMVKINGTGKEREIAVEISGSDTNNPPIEIDEILIGYNQLRGL